MGKALVLILISIVERVIATEFRKFSRWSRNGAAKDQPSARSIPPYRPPRAALDARMIRDRPCH